MNIRLAQTEKPRFSFSVLHYVYIDAPHPDHELSNWETNFPQLHISILKGICVCVFFFPSFLLLLLNGVAVIVSHAPLCRFLTHLVCRPPQEQANIRP